MKIRDLARFVAAADELHFPRTAEGLGIPLAALYSAIERLEEEAGTALFIRDGARPRLTPAGKLLLDDARAELASAPPPSEKPKPAGGGGKAKASKGKGRAPIVKGQPKPYKKRQGR